MLTLRKADERGHADHGWLQSRFSFSFAEYQDPQHVHFGPLRVINDDYIAPGQGFGMHGHKDMEIVTYVLEGAVAQRLTGQTAAMLRPERISVGGEAQARASGTVNEVQYFGSFTRLRVDLGDTQLQADLPAGTAAPEAGQSVHLHWDDSALHALQST